MKTILRNTQSGCYYDYNLGGFAQRDATKATVFTEASQEAFIKAHFENPQFIKSVIWAPDTETLPAILQEMADAGVTEVLCAGGCTELDGFALDLPAILQGNTLVGDIASFSKSSVTYADLIRHAAEAGISLCKTFELVGRRKVSVEAWESKQGLRTVIIYTVRPSDAPSGILVPDYEWDGEPINDREENYL